MLVGSDWCAESVGICENFCFPLEVNLGLDVGCIDGYMTQPGSDDVHVDANLLYLANRTTKGWILSQADQIGHDAERTGYAFRQLPKEGVRHVDISAAAIMRV